MLGALAVQRVTLIPGDGIGPEVAAATRAVVLAAGAAVEFEEVAAGMRAVEESGSALPRAVFDSIEHTKIMLKGPTATPFGGDFRVAVERPDASGKLAKRSH